MTFDLTGCISVLKVNASYAPLISDMYVVEDGQVTGQNTLLCGLQTPLILDHSHFAVADMNRVKSSLRCCHVIVCSGRSTG